MEEFFGNIELWLSGLGTWAYFIAPLVMTAVSILPIPAEAPAMANGMLFGPVTGTIITWTGGMCGAWISYEIARSWGRPLARRISSDEAVARIDRGTERAGWWGLLVLRFVPVVAFTALNWGSGLCGVPRWRFLWTTALGIAPGAAIFTTSGVGLITLWRRSPPLAGGLMIVLLLLSVIWTIRRGAPEAIG